MYGIGRAEAARFERDSRCFERDTKCFERDTKRARAPFQLLFPLTPYFRPPGSDGGPDPRITPRRGLHLKRKYGISDGREARGVS